MNSECSILLAAVITHYKFILNVFLFICNDPSSGPTFFKAGFYFTFRIFSLTVIFQHVLCLCFCRITVLRVLCQGMHSDIVSGPARALVSSSCVRLACDQHLTLSAECALYHSLSSPSLVLPLMPPWLFSTSSYTAVSILLRVFPLLSSHTLLFLRVLFTSQLFSNNS